MFLHETLHILDFPSQQYSNSFDISLVVKKNIVVLPFIKPQMFVSQFQKDDCIYSGISNHLLVYIIYLHGELKEYIKTDFVKKKKTDKKD